MRQWFTLDRHDALLVISLLIATSNKHTNIVLFGQAGGGKSSLVNLMAGKHVATTANDMRSCTLHWQEYPIEFEGESYRVFDTVGLQEPQLGIPQYLDAVENAYTLIQNLERQAASICLYSVCVQADSLIHFKPIIGSFTNSSVTKRSCRHCDHVPRKLGRRNG
ncbi:hypothetical protein BDR07DRAFT_952101 [Suillus spraguei]|nr:hypothetical protein BDR07DRAFT_952101 [Suillus spraguei]